MCIKRNHRLFSIISIIVFSLLLSPGLLNSGGREIFKNNKDCVVLIKTLDKYDRVEGQGSGFIVDKNGLILTNYHVISNAYSARLKILGKWYNVTGVVHVDEQRDFAVIRINGKGLPAVRIGDPSDVQAGDRIYVISNPKGIEKIITSGDYSGKRHFHPNGQMLAFSAPISPGSSGGPVFDEYGKVIGIVTASRRNAQNLNIAVPIDVVPIHNLSTRGKSLEKQPRVKYEETADYWRNVAFSLLDAQKYDEALDAVKKCLTINPRDGGAYFIKAQIYDELGNTAMAIENQNTSVKYNPSSAIGLAYLGHLYSKAELFIRALQVLKIAYSIDSRSFITNLELGICYGELERYSDAIKSFKKSISLEPNDAISYHNLGLVYIKMERYEDAIQPLIRATQLEPDSVKHYMVLSYAQWSSYDRQGAAETYRQIIRLYPNHIEAHYFLGHLYKDMGYSDRAIREYEILKKLDKKKAQALYDYIFR